VLGHPTSGRKPTLKDTSRLPYVEATVLELMRIETAGPLSMARRTLDDALVSGFFIPKGTTVSEKQTCGLECYGLSIFIAKKVATVCFHVCHTNLKFAL
jgi:hypothetical protein